MIKTKLRITRKDDPYQRGSIDDIYAKTSVFVDEPGFANGKVELTVPVYKHYTNSSIKDHQMNGKPIVIMDINRPAAMNRAAWKALQKEVERLFSFSLTDKNQETQPSADISPLDEIEIVFE